MEAKDKYLFSGIGFVFTGESGIIGIDIDHCLADGQPNEVAAAILAKLPPTYIEVSPSGSGIHIFIKGTLPPGGNKNSKTGVEMYGSHRYFTMTGNRWKNCADEIALDNGVLNWIHGTYIKPKRQPKSRNEAVNQGISNPTHLSFWYDELENKMYVSAAEKDELDVYEIPKFYWRKLKYHSPCEISRRAFLLALQHRFSWEDGSKYSYPGDNGVRNGNPSVIFNMSEGVRER